MVVEAIDLYGMSPEDILKYLPMKNCGNCGKNTCEEFALSLNRNESKIEGCSEIAHEMRGSLEGSLSIRLEIREADESMSSVQESLIPMNDPTPDSPVLITGNSAVTLYILKMIFEKTPDVSVWIIPTDTKGFTVDHIMSMNLMTPMTVSKALMASGITGKVKSKVMMIPGLCEGIERSISNITRWKTIVGPRSGFELPAYLTHMAKEGP